MWRPSAGQALADTTGAHGAPAPPPDAPNPSSPDASRPTCATSGTPAPPQVSPIRTPPRSPRPADAPADTTAAHGSIHAYGEDRHGSLLRLEGGAPMVSPSAMYVTQGYVAYAHGGGPPCAGRRGDHYCAYIRREGKWYRAHDADVETLERPPDAFPYLIFLERLEACPGEVPLRTRATTNRWSSGQWKDQWCSDRPGPQGWRTDCRKWKEDLHGAHFHASHGPR